MENFATVSKFAVCADGGMCGMLPYDSALEWVLESNLSVDENVLPGNLFMVPIVNGWPNGNVKLGTFDKSAASLRWLAGNNRKARDIVEKYLLADIDSLKRKWKWLKLKKSVARYTGR